MIVQLQKSGCINSKISSRMAETLKILDDNYGKARDVIKDLGGIALWIDNKNEWKEAQELFHLKLGMEENIEFFEMENGRIVKELLFQISSDYGVVVYTTETDLES